jgi:hypothetical protein
MQKDVLIVEGIDEADLIILLDALYREIRRRSGDRHSRNANNRQVFKRLVKSAKALRRAVGYEAWQVPMFANGDMLVCLNLEG